MSLRHASSPLVAIALLAACSGSSPSSPTTPALPQIAGTYSGPITDNEINPPQQVDTWLLQWLRPGQTSPRFQSCTGTLVILQTGSSFTGSFTQDGTCPPTSGQISNGTIRSDGSVVFTLNGPAADPFAWTGFKDCTPLVSGTTQLSGTVIGPKLDASFTHDAFVHCAADGDITVNVRVRATR